MELIKSLPAPPSATEDIHGLVKYVNGPTLLHLAKHKRIDAPPPTSPFALAACPCTVSVYARSIQQRKSKLFGRKSTPTDQRSPRNERRIEQASTTTVWAGWYLFSHLHHQCPVLRLHCDPSHARFSC